MTTYKTAIEACESLGLDCECYLEGQAAESYAMEVLVDNYRVIAGSNGVVVSL